MIRMAMVRREDGPVARVTFTLPGTIWADTIYLVGEFNDWNTTTHPFTQDRSGTWTLSVDLALNQTHVLAYLCDGQWLTDDHPDGWIWDAGGRHAFLVITDEQRVRVPAAAGRGQAIARQSRELSDLNLLGALDEPPATHTGSTA